MADDETKEPTDEQPEAAPEEESGSGDSKKQSLDDLKAKLGIVTKTQKTEAVQETPKRTTAEDFEFSLNAPEAAPEAALDESVDLEAAFSGGKTRLALRWIIGIAVLVVVLLGVGTFFGKVMKERSIENYKSREAGYIIGYLTGAKGEKLGVEEGTVLEAVSAHITDTATVYSLLQKATEPQAIVQAEQQLKLYLARCRDYRDKRPLYVFETVFPGVIYNQELAADVVKYVNAVAKVFDETALLALEADTLARVTEIEDKGEMIEKIFIEPSEINGQKWMKGVFITRMDEENPVKEKGVTMYPVLPYGAEKGFLVPTTSLVQVDVVPIAKNKSARYKGAINSRVRSRLAKVKQATDVAGFETLKEKLEKLAARDAFFTLF